MRNSDYRCTNQCTATKPPRCRACGMLALVGAVLVLLALFSSPSFAGLAGDCLWPDTGFDNCTANDVHLAKMQVLAVKKGCVSANDYALINMQVTFNAASPTRYDVGLYLATDGGDAINKNASANTGGCFKEALFPVLGKDVEPTKVQRDSGTGPYLNRDGGNDSCGDVEGSNTYVRNLVSGDISTKSTTSADITIKCSDTVGTDGKGSPNGYVDIGWVTSWDQNAGGTCTSVLHAKPGTTSKCDAGYVDTANTDNKIPIGVPNLSVTKTCIPTSVAPGKSFDCTISYTNSSELGPADNIEFHDSAFMLDNVILKGTYSSMMTSTGYVDMSTGLPVWRPNTADSSKFPGIANIKGTSDPSKTSTGSLTYQFTVASTVTGGHYNSTVMGWYNNGTYTAVQEKLKASAAVDVGPSTLVQLGDFKASGYDSGIALAWKTHAELDNAGFNLWRAKGPAAARYSRINPSLIPAEGSVSQGASYKYDDTGLTSGSTYFYKLEDIDTSGVSTFHGPAVATVGSVNLTEPSTGATLSAAHPATFSWEATGYNRFIVQFSTTKDFGSISAQYPAPYSSGRFAGKKRWLMQTDWTPKSAEWKRIKAAALATNKKAIYWRVYAENRFGAGFTSEPNVLALAP